MSSFDFAKGEVLLVDKEMEWTSFDVVNSIRSSLRKTYNIKKFKVGHAGTLDPLATGLLLVCTGKATKTIDSLQVQDKVYTGSIFLGGTTPSFDKETEIDKEYPTDHITEELILKTAKTFEGEIDQVPPVYSALKINGKRAYQYARNNEEVIMKSRKIHIHYFKITKIELPEIYFEVKCSKGTYIRSLARDFGADINSGGYLSSLRRTKIGEFSVNNALKVKQIKDIISAFTPLESSL
ncbi:MAG: tRNA pseudouridine(55) synthase TruB [Bacteroidales bacterium]|nr:tRNA pseudouridine(55) synthase TruB [Bacteroidales bacterium]